MSRNSMRYNPIQDQWYVDIHGREYNLHCGESFEIYIGCNTIPCRLELANKWYVILGNTRFDLRQDDQYTIKL